MIIILVLVVIAGYLIWLRSKVQAPVSPQTTEVEVTATPTPQATSATPSATPGKEATGSMKEKASTGGAVAK